MRLPCGILIWMHSKEIFHKDKKIFNWLIGDLKILQISTNFLFPPPPLCFTFFKQQIDQYLFEKPRGEKIAEQCSGGSVNIIDYILPQFYAKKIV